MPKHRFIRENFRVKTYHIQKDEPKRVFSAFVAYRGLNRGSRALKDMIAMDRWKPEEILHWYTEYDWEARVKEFDAEADSQLRWRNIRDIEKMNRTQAALGVSCQSLAFAEMKKILAISIATENSVLSIKDVVMLGEFGTRTERLSRGEATEITEVNNESPVDLSKLTVEELVLLKQLKAKAAKDD